MGTKMTRATHAFRTRIDRAGLALSGLCATHCLLNIFIVSALGIGGEFLLAPEIHRVGLALALMIAAVAIGWGAMQHRQTIPSVVAVTGLICMGGALAVPHGSQEVILTVVGVTLVSIGHILNLRAAR